MDEKKTAVFLDRDGTLNMDKGYTYLYENWEWLPGTLKALKLLNKTGANLVVVTNQAGIAKSLYTEKDVLLLHKKIDADLKKEGVVVSGWYYCPHHPDFTGPCECRKPKTGMFKKAAKDLNISLKDSYMVGDKKSDIEAGLNAGMRLVILVRTGYGDLLEVIPPGVRVAENISEATNIILSDISKKK
ncbi:MAG: HAD family hydrolase [Deltaproteobacteria bacterium]|jgi:D-glycero-D-manno-heptose 1,7-bisphosphate phosphatase|nr:HAD family hydrolase [Deltaproteobacteria bacterium]